MEDNKEDGNVSENSDKDSLLNQEPSVAAVNVDTDKLVRKKKIVRPAFSPYSARPKRSIKTPSRYRNEEAL